MGSKRLLQVGEQIRDKIALMIVRGEVSDPRVRNVTINFVKMTPDLSSAKVYYSVLGDESTKAATKRGLDKAAGFFRHAIAEHLKIRYTPEIRFYFDDTIERADQINTLLNKVRRESAEVEEESTPKKDT